MLQGSACASCMFVRRQSQQSVAATELDHPQGKESVSSSPTSPKSKNFAEIFQATTSKMLVTRPQDLFHYYAGGNADDSIQRRNHVHSQNPPKIPNAPAVSSVASRTAIRLRHGQGFTKYGDNQNGDPQGFRMFIFWQTQVVGASRPR